MNPEALSNEGQRHVASEMAQRIVQLETQIAEAREALDGVEHFIAVNGAARIKAFGYSVPFLDSVRRLAAALREDS